MRTGPNFYEYHAFQIDGLTGKSFKFDEIDKTTRKVASGLAKLGVKKGDKIVLLCSNTPEWAVCFLAGIALGAVVCPFDPTSPTGLSVFMSVCPSVILAQLKFRQLYYHNANKLT